MENQLFEKVKAWGRERGINNPEKQTCKLLEECGELASEVCRGRYNSPEFRDAIGDIQVVVTILADMCGHDNLECLAEAYEVIENRDGKTKDGCFIKDSDLK